MNQNDINSVLIEAAYLMDLVMDEAYHQHDRGFNVMDAQCAVSELIQRARLLYQGDKDRMPLSSDTLELIARLDADTAIDNAQYMAKGEGK